MNTKLLNERDYNQNFLSANYIHKKEKMKAHNRRANAKRKERTRKKMAAQDIAGYYLKEYEYIGTRKEVFVPERTVKRIVLDYYEIKDRFGRVLERIPYRRLNAEIIPAHMENRRVFERVELKTPYLKKYSTKSAWEKNEQKVSKKRSRRNAVDWRDVQDAEYENMDWDDDLFMEYYHDYSNIRRTYHNRRIR